MEERGHDGLTTEERIAQMTQPIAEDWYSHQIAIVNKRNAKLEADNKALLDENEQLKQWKREQLFIESEWNPQEVGRELGIRWGKSIRAEILPAVLKLKAAAKYVIERAETIASWDGVMDCRHVLDEMDLTNLRALIEHSEPQ
jgi:hypothetical protein